MYQIVKNSKFLNDSFVQKKIYNSIKETIRQAKIGRIWVKGNYEFMISDPIAQCRSALGLTPNGILKSGEIYSNFWNKRNINGEICLMRSPLTHYSEINIEELVDNEDTAKWYKYIYSGIIYNIYDISVVRHADSDFDGDIVCSTNNEYFIKGAKRDELPISYDKEMVPTQKITLPNQIKCDIRGLNTKVGQITNYSTSMIAMLPLFLNKEQKEQLEEMNKRIKLLREIQGAEIDKIKGTTPPQFPKEWRYWIKINKDDDDILKSEKYKYNSMVVKKKPYFFIYLYNSLMNEYKKYEKNFNNISYKHFNMSIKDLIKKENKNDGENKLVRKYRKYLPILDTNCVMNSLCKEFENMDFDIKYNKDKNNMLLNYYHPQIYDKNKLEILTLLFKEYKSQKQYKALSIVLDNEGINQSDISDMMNKVLYGHRDEFRNKIRELFSSTLETFNYLMEVCKINNFSYDFVWDILNDDILEIIPFENSVTVVSDDDGIEYLGNKYKLQEIKNVGI